MSAPQNVKSEARALETPDLAEARPPVDRERQSNAPHATTDPRQDPGRLAGVLRRVEPGPGFHPLASGHHGWPYSEAGVVNGPAPLAASVVSLVVFFFSALTSTAFKWHPGITGPLTIASAVALVASVVWLNRSAGRGDEDEGSPQ